MNTAVLQAPAANGTLQRIEIAGVGPIQANFPIDLNGYGVYVLRGSKGEGKSTALTCIELLAGHKVDLRPGGKRAIAHGDNQRSKRSDHGDDSG